MEKHRKNKNTAEEPSPAASSSGTTSDVTSAMMVPDVTAQPTPSERLKSQPTTSELVKSITVQRSESSEPLLPSTSKMSSLKPSSFVSILASPVQLNPAPENIDEIEIMGSGSVDPPVRRESLEEELGGDTLSPLVSIPRGPKVREPEVHFGGITTHTFTRQPRENEFLRYDCEGKWVTPLIYGCIGGFCLISLVTIVTLAIYVSYSSDNATANSNETKRMVVFPRLTNKNVSVYIHHDEKAKKPIPKKKTKVVGLHNFVSVEEIIRALRNKIPLESLSET